MHHRPGDGVLSDDLPKVADELFLLPPGEFTRRRNEIAKELKQGGDAEGSAKVSALSKPSLAAWALNQVARWNSKMVRALTDIDETLRKPDSSSEFRKASAERHRIVGQIVRAASEVLENSGHKAGSAVTQKITQTLLAVGYDDAARESLAQGRLVTDLKAGGPGGDMWDVSIPEGPGEPPAPEKDESESRAGARVQAEVRKRRQKIAREVELLKEAAEKAGQIAREARDRAEEARAESKGAEAAAAEAEKQAAEADDALERMEQKLAGLAE